MDLINSFITKIKSKRELLFSTLQAHESSLYNSKNYKLLSEFYLIAAVDSMPIKDLKISRFALLNGDFTTAQTYALKQINDPVYQSHANLLLGNALACQNNYNDSYNKLVSVLTNQTHTTDFQILLTQVIDDLEEIQFRNDGNFKVLNSDFIRFSLGLYYYYNIKQNASYKQRFINKFRCFLASNKGNSSMEKFCTVANAMLK
jgi:hypothetical protein